MEVSQEVLDMTTAIRLVTLTLVLSLTAGGPLAPALAQQPAPPPPAVEPAPPVQPAPAVQPVPPVQPAPPVEPAPAVQPDLFPERMKTTRNAERHAVAYNVGAGIANVFLVPGRVITCALGSAVGIVVLAITLGSGYRAAAAVGEEGCGGKWIVTGEDLWPDPPATSGFDGERR
jgi:hypothetical protein